MNSLKIININICKVMKISQIQIYYFMEQLFYVAYKINSLVQIKIALYATSLIMDFQ